MSPIPAYRFSGIHLMMRWIAPLTAVAMMVGTTASLAQEAAYACVSANNTGFALNANNTLEQTNFVDTKFTAIHRGNQLTLRVDGKDEVYTCEAPWANSPHILQCAEAFYFVTFDMNTLRFVRSLMYGYINDSRDTLHIMYGDCQKF
jgi:hypothetical protein